jgi:flagellar motor switch protein FliG
MQMGKTRSLNGRSKAAIIAISLGTEAAASVFKHLKDDEIEQLILEISRIGSVEPTESEKAMEEFYEMCLAQKYITEGGMEFAREVLEKAFGSQGANNIIDKIASSLKVRAFEFIRKIEPQYLLGFLQNEHPQTIALVLSYARIEQASHIISMLPKDKQLDIVERIATLDRTSPETIRDVEASLEKKLSSVFSDQFMEAGGVKNVAEILNHVDRGTEKFISEELFKRNQPLAEEIRKRMFVFEDIVTLDEMSVQRVLRDINTKDLTIALKGSNTETQEAIFANLSTRLRDTVREEMQYLRGIRVRDVDEAQQRIVDIVRKLDETGEITIQRGGMENDLI